MAKRLLSLLLILLLCLTYAGACALVVQVGDETFILDDSELSESSEISIVTEDGTILENGDVLVPVQTPNAQWLHEQLENTDQTQFLQDITSALYLVNCLQTRDTSSAENITVGSLEGFLDFFFAGGAALTFEGTDSCYLALSGAAYMKFNLDGIYITGASLCLPAVENAFGQPVCVDFLLQ